MGCLCCGAASGVGALCASCALEVEPCDGLLSDHLRSKFSSSDAVGWVVDGFGVAHAIGANTRIGRDHDSDLSVLARSVSRHHAELARTAAGYTVRDLGSRNGTFINGVRIREPVALPPRARLTLGDVSLWFLAELADEPPRRPVIPTDDAGGGLVRYQMTSGEIELCVVAGDDVVGGGALLWRSVGSEPWSERGLAPLEFQLIRALCMRADDEASSPSPIRGCVATKELARDLPFQSKFANQENVRQVVMRLRGVLVEVGVRGLVAVAPGRGYYLSCAVTTVGGAGSGTGGRRRRSITTPARRRAAPRPRRRTLR